MIRNIDEKDIAAVCDIYNYYIENTAVSFEEELLPVSEMEARINDVTKNYPWLVYEENNLILGYAYAGCWNKRTAYRYTAECTVYLSHEAVGKGIGTKLYAKLISILKERSFHTLIGGIALPNPASVALHEKLGFTKAAHYKEVGWKMNRWHDVGYWELRLQDSDTTPSFRNV